MLPVACYLAHLEPSRPEQTSPGRLSAGASPQPLHPGPALGRSPSHRPTKAVSGRPRATQLLRLPGGAGILRFSEGGHCPSPPGAESAGKEAQASAVDRSPEVRAGPCGTQGHRGGPEGGGAVRNPRQHWSQTPSRGARGHGRLALSGTEDTLWPPFLASHPPWSLLFS